MKHLLRIIGTIVLDNDYMIIGKKRAESFYLRNVPDQGILAVPCQQAYDDRAIHHFLNFFKN
jgi:hypothetical protein